MGNGLPIDIDTFRNLNSEDAKLDALFDVLVCMHQAGYECGPDREKRLRACEDRFQKLEHRKWFDRGIAGIGGVIGGILAGLGIKIN